MDACLDYRLRVSTTSVARLESTVAKARQAGKLVVIVPSCAERYLSSWLFADVDTESDRVEDVLPPATRS